MIAFDQPPRDPRLDRLQRNALVVGVVAIVLSGVGSVLTPADFFLSYLVAFMFVLGLALGGMAVVMLQHLTGGAWGVVVRRPLEAAAGTLPLVAVLFLPLVFGIPTLYPWARPEVVAQSEVLQSKAAYLNVPFFLVRAVLYFVVWLTLAWFLIRWSGEQDRTGSMEVKRRVRRLSAGGLIVYALTISAASVDWLMSLQPEWFSTIFGLLVMTGQALLAFAFATVLLARFREWHPLSAVLAPRRFHDLGNLLLAFVMLWSYLAFSQFLITWSANLPEEVIWYVPRVEAGWSVIGIALIVFHFAVPFVLLLFRQMKRSATPLLAVAAGLILMRLVDIYWLVVPSLHQDAVYLPWLVLVTPVGLGGVWLAAFIWQLKQRPLVPLGDPGLEGALVSGGH